MAAEKDHQPESHHSEPVAHAPHTGGTQGAAHMSAVDARRAAGDKDQHHPGSNLRMYIWGASGRFMLGSYFDDPDQLEPEFVEWAFSDGDEQLTEAARSAPGVPARYRKLPTPQIDDDYDILAKALITAFVRHKAKREHKTINLGNGFALIVTGRNDIDTVARRLGQRYPNNAKLWQDITREAKMLGPELDEGAPSLDLEKQVQQTVAGDPALRTEAKSFSDIDEHLKGYRRDLKLLEIALSDAQRQFEDARSAFHARNLGEKADALEAEVAKASADLAFAGQFLGVFTNSIKGMAGDASALISAGQNLATMWIGVLNQANAAEATAARLAAKEAQLAVVRDHLQNAAKTLNEHGALVPQFQNDFPELFRKYTEQRLTTEQKYDDANPSGFKFAELAKERSPIAAFRSKIESYEGALATDLGDIDILANRFAKVDGGWEVQASWAELWAYRQDLERRRDLSWTLRAKVDGRLDRIDSTRERADNAMQLGAHRPAR